MIPGRHVINLRNRECGGKTPVQFRRFSSSTPTRLAEGLGPKRLSPADWRYAPKTWVPRSRRLPRLGRYINSLNEYFCQAPQMILVFKFINQLQNTIKIKIVGQSGHPGGVGSEDFGFGGKLAADGRQPRHVPQLGRLPQAGGRFLCQRRRESAGGRFAGAAGSAAAGIKEATAPSARPSDPWKALNAEFNSSAGGGLAGSACLTSFSNATDCCCRSLAARLPATPLMACTSPWARSKSPASSAL